IQDLTKIEVVTGLNEGDIIVTAPFSAISKTLKRESKVKIVTEEMLKKPIKL
ncbi:MAG TPA: efflux transporter periplasmic adaptor subunit, partial [Rikenellaceae bacterium]|nr:efflux transporter periplasmic adaptor subunit [Rikenellaceae bacterium]